MARRPHLTGPDDVRAAHAAIAGRVHRTPVFGSRSLSERLPHGNPVVLKAEGFQRTGAFKIRGALHRVAALDEHERRRGVVSFSAGNHAQAVALACRLAGVPAKVFMPAGADAGKVAATRAYGAEVDQSAGTAADLMALVERDVEEEGRVLVHPFDDPLVMAGQGTVALELLEQAPEVTTLLVPVSGGGLLGGIAAFAGPAGIRLIGVEPAAKPTVGRRLGLTPDGPSHPTMADALTAPFVGEHCAAVLERHVSEVLAVGEDEIADAMAFLLARAKLVAEPGAAVAVAALLHGHYVPGREEVVGVVVSGSNVGPQRLAAILAAA